MAACVKYEIYMSIGVAVTCNTSLGVRRVLRWRRRRPDQKHNIPEISKLDIIIINHSKGK